MRRGAPPDRTKPSGKAERLRRTPLFPGHPQLHFTLTWGMMMMMMKEPVCASLAPPQSPNPTAPSRPTAIAAFSYAEQKRKPAVPRVEDKPVMGIQTQKNFITANAVEAILQGQARHTIPSFAQQARKPVYLILDRGESGCIWVLHSIWVSHSMRRTAPAKVCKLSPSLT